jgi:hypothetical protein
MRRKLGALIVIAFACTDSGSAPSAPSTLQESGSSGIKGITRSVVISGVPGGPTVGGPASIEFAVAPVIAGQPAFDKATFVKSDTEGMFEVKLPPETYWIGPKGKALDPLNYDPGSTAFSELTILVKERAFTSVELVQTLYAP